MEDVNYLRKHLSFQRSQFAHHYLTPHDLWFEEMWTLHSTAILSSSPNPNHKTPQNPPWLRAHSFEDASPWWPPLLDKELKLFFSSSKTPSLRFSLVSESVQSLSHVQIFATPWIAASQDSLSITNSWSSLKLTSIESPKSEPGNNRT